MAGWQRRIFFGPGGPWDQTFTKMWVLNTKNRGIGFNTPQNGLDGENNGKAYEQMDDLVGFPTIFGRPPMC